MLLKNGVLLIGDQLVRADLRFTERIIKIGNISGQGDMDCNGCYVLPGLVDIHSHGALGMDFSDGNPADLQPLGHYYASCGVTSFLSTTMTLQEQPLTRAMQAVRNFRSSSAKCAGVHLEGPFLNFAKRGAQNPDNLRVPDIDMFDRLNAASGGKVKLVTIACEEPGALDFIRRASRVCTVSLGHSTADYDAALEAFRAGASHATHLFNGMPPFLHRAPGIVGAAMDTNASAELICDGLHIHPSVVRAAFKMFGSRLCLISDSLRSTKMADGEYELGGQRIVLCNGMATLMDGTLAGSSISLLEGLRNAVSFGIDLASAAYAAATAPARAIGLNDRGSIEAGKAADIILLNKDLELKAVFIDGKRYEA